MGHYYAEELAYDGAQSAADVLRRFDSRAERDAWAAKANADIATHAWPITYKAARRQYDWQWYTRGDGAMVCDMRADYIADNLL